MNDQQAPTDDDIARMAREAGLQLAVSAEAYPVITGQLRRFAGFVAAAEREAIFRLANEMEVEETHYCMHVYEEGKQYKQDLLAAIRARGEA